LFLFLWCTFFVYPPLSTTRSVLQTGRSQGTENQNGQARWPGKAYEVFLLYASASQSLKGFCEREWEQPDEEKRGGLAAVSLLNLRNSTSTAGGKQHMIFLASSFLGVQKPPFVFSSLSVSFLVFGARQGHTRCTVLSLVQPL